MVLRINQYRLFFFSNEANEPLHIHIESGEKYAKFWLEPVKLEKSIGYNAKELTEIRNIVTENTSVIKTHDAMASEVWFDTHMMHVRLLDGREISVPVEWFPKLRSASEKQRNNWRLIGKGIGIHWEEIDEDISVSALLKT